MLVNHLISQASEASGDFSVGFGGSTGLSSKGSAKREKLQEELAASTGAFMLAVAQNGFRGDDARAPCLPLQPVIGALRRVSAAEGLRRDDVHAQSDRRSDVSRQLPRGHGPAFPYDCGYRTGGARFGKVGGRLYAFPLPRPASHDLSRKVYALQPSCARLGPVMSGLLGHCCACLPQGSGLNTCPPLRGDCKRSSSKGNRRRRRAAQKASPTQVSKGPKSGQVGPAPVPLHHQSSPSPHEANATRSSNSPLSPGLTLLGAAPQATPCPPQAASAQQPPLQAQRPPRLTFCRFFVFCIPRIEDQDALCRLPGQCFAPYSGWLPAPCQVSVPDAHAFLWHFWPYRPADVQQVPPSHRS